MSHIEIPRSDSQCIQGIRPYSLSQSSLNASQCCTLSATAKLPSILRATLATLATAQLLLHLFFPLRSQGSLTGPSLGSKSILLMVLNPRSPLLAIQFQLPRPPNEHPLSPTREIPANRLRIQAPRPATPSTTSTTEILIRNIPSDLL
jgi:hypothetical protein